jgi:hypothetical protein
VGHKNDANEVTVDRVEQVDDREYAVTWHYEFQADGSWVCGAPTVSLLHLARGEWGCTVQSADVPDDVWRVLADAAYAVRDARRAA